MIAVIAQLRPVSDSHGTQVFRHTFKQIEKGLFRQCRIVELPTRKPVRTGVGPDHPPSCGQTRSPPVPACRRKIVICGGAIYQVIDIAGKMHTPRKPPAFSLSAGQWTQNKNCVRFVLVCLVTINMAQRKRPGTAHTGLHDRVQCLPVLYFTAGMTRSSSFALDKHARQTRPRVRTCSRRNKGHALLR